MSLSIGLGLMGDSGGDAGGGGGAALLDTVAGINAEFEYDFSEGSFNDGLTFQSLITPNTGTDAQSDYNAAVQDGTAALTAADASNPAFIQGVVWAQMGHLTDFCADMAKLDNPYWLAVIFRQTELGSLTARAFDSLISTLGGGDNQNGVAMSIRGNSAYDVLIRHEQNNTGREDDTSVQHTVGQWSLAVASVDTSSMDLWIDSSTRNETRSSQAAGANPSSKAPAIFTGNSGTPSVDYAFLAGGQAKLTDSNVADIITNLKNRTVGNWISFT